VFRFGFSLGLVWAQTRATQVQGSARANPSGFLGGHTRGGVLTREHLLSLYEHRTASFLGGHLKLFNKVFNDPQTLCMRKECFVLVTFFSQLSS